MTKQNEEELLRRRNELEAELDAIKDSLNYIEKERRENQVKAVIEMVEDNPSIWSAYLVNQIDCISPFDVDKYKVVLVLEYDNLDDDD